MEAANDKEAAAKTKNWLSERKRKGFIILFFIFIFFVFIVRKRPSFSRTKRWKRDGERTSGVVDGWGTRRGNFLRWMLTQVWKGRPGFSVSVCFPHAECFVYRNIVWFVGDEDQN